MKKPDILKPKDLYRELSPNILEDYICTVVHAHFKGSKFYMISQMFTGGENEELYMLFDEEQTEKLMINFRLMTQKHLCNIAHMKTIPT